MATEAGGLDAPWHGRRWLADRVAELLWQLLSWPYIVAVAVTARFLEAPTELMREAMYVSWLIALGNRGYKAWLVFKGGQAPANGGKP